MHNILVGMSYVKRCKLRILAAAVCLLTAARTILAATSTHCHIRPKTCFSLISKISLFSPPHCSETFSRCSDDSLPQRAKSTSHRHSLFSSIWAYSLQRNLSRYSENSLPHKSSQTDLTRCSEFQTRCSETCQFWGKLHVSPPTQTSHNESYFVVDLNCTYLVSKAFLSCLWNSSRLRFDWRFLQLHSTTKFTLSIFTYTSH